MRELTLNEVADILRVNPMTIRRAIKEGKLKGVKKEGKFGKQYFINVDDLPVIQSLKFLGYELIDKTEVVKRTDLEKLLEAIQLINYIIENQSIYQMENENLLVIAKDKLEQYKKLLLEK